MWIMERSNWRAGEIDRGTSFRRVLQLIHPGSRLRPTEGTSILPKFLLRRRAKQEFMGCWYLHLGTSTMTDDPSSELAKIARLNGDFKRNYGTLLGAFLYIRSINAARGRSWFWAGLISLLYSAAMAWLGKHGFSWLVGG